MFSFYLVNVYFTEAVLNTVAPSLAPNISLLCRELVDLLKTTDRCQLLLSKFIPAYHHHFGRQCRVADYGYTKLLDLFESISHVVQVCSVEHRYCSILTNTFYADYGRRHQTGDHPLASGPSASLYLRFAACAQSSTSQANCRHRFSGRLRESYGSHVQSGRVRSLHVRGSAGFGAREYCGGRSIRNCDRRMRTVHLRAEKGTNHRGGREDQTVCSRGESFSICVFHIGCCILSCRKLHLLSYFALNCAT